MAVAFADVVSKVLCHFAASGWGVGGIFVVCYLPSLPPSVCLCDDPLTTGDGGVVQERRVMITVVSSFLHSS